MGWFRALRTIHRAGLGHNSQAFDAVEENDTGMQTLVTLLLIAGSAAPALSSIIPSRAGTGTGSAVDPALVGTWKLEAPGSPIYWVVRGDGVYRVHGPGAPVRQFGRIEATKGRWSVKSAVWADEGSYRLADAKTWVVTGRMATGTWKRIWAPVEAGSQTPSGQGTCRLVTPTEVARVLSAPAAGQPDVRAGDGGCVFTSQLSSLDQLSISIRQNQANFFQNLRKGAGARAVNVPGVGDQAYAETVSGLTIQFLKGTNWVKLSLGLQPWTAIEDLPYLSELARAAAGRL